MAKKERSRRFGCHSTTEGVVARATLRDVRMSPRKARLVLNLIKGKEVDTALRLLQHNPKRIAKIMKKLLESAVANARENTSVDVDDLLVSGGSVDMGKTLRRFLPRAQGRATRIRKRSAHITLLLGEKA